MPNIITDIQVSGVTYQIQGSGGGKAIEAGRGITVTTGATADTVSFNLPIYKGSGTSNLILGDSTNPTASGTSCIAVGNANTKAIGQYSFAWGEGAQASGITSPGGAPIWAIGTNSLVKGNNSFAFGKNLNVERNYSFSTGEYNNNYYSAYASFTTGSYNNAYNFYEASFGHYNNSVSASTSFGNSGNTLFSVGNGTSTSARHNAFEVRQNGDIYLSSGGTDIKLQDHLGGGGSVTVDTALDSGSTNPVENRVIYNKIDEVEEVTAAGLNALNDKITPTVELTQAQYDALVTAGTVAQDTYYIITDAQAGDLTNYYTKSETNTLLGGKQATLVSGTNIKTINNESLLGSGNIDIQGGGKAVSGGTNISITTGETADTINCTLPYYKVSDTDNYTIYGSTVFKNKATYAYSTMFIGGSNEVNGNSASRSYTNNSVIGYNNKINSNITSYSKGNNVVIGDNNSLSGTNLSYSYVIGSYNSGYTSNTLLTGWYNQAHNAYESSFGKYNASNTGSTDADKSLFSVGNGTSTSARHNAFEIRQNGDIYLTKDGQDVKLQDTITATTANTTALGGLSLVKLTQAQYDALVTKDNSTLYVIVD